MAGDQMPDPTHSEPTSSDSRLRRRLRQATATMVCAHGLAKEFRGVVSEFTKAIALPVLLVYSLRHGGDLLETLRALLL